MRIAVFGNLMNNEVSDLTNQALCALKAYAKAVTLIVSDPVEEPIMLPCNELYCYSKLTGNDDNLIVRKMVEDYILMYKPDIVVIAMSCADQVIPKIALKCHYVSFLACNSLLLDGPTVQVAKNVYGGNASAHYQVESPLIMSFKPLKFKENFLSMKDTKIQISSLRGVYNKDRDDTEIEIINQDDLLSANFVIVCGMGVNNQEEINKIIAFSRKIGAAVGGTKKVIDHGWLPIHHLIGQTGHTISPKICLVLGASGATPFMNGILDSEIIVAINSDKNARIFDYADYGIVDDFKTVIIELERKWSGL